MPEFEENEDAAKNAPYTYEPSRSSAAELGELAGVVITPAETKKTPTKSRWGKPADQESSGGIADDVPAGEVDLSNVSHLTDDLIKKGGASNRAPREDNRREERNSGSRSERPRRRSEMAKVEENVGDVPQMENARKGLRENARKDPKVIAQKVGVEIGDVVTGKKTKAQLISQQTRNQSQKANQ